MPLELGANITDPDGFYEALIAAHEGLDDDESAALNARLIFVLANQIGDTRVLLDALACARKVPTGDVSEER